MILSNVSIQEDLKVSFFTDRIRALVGGDHLFWRFGKAIRETKSCLKT